MEDSVVREQEQKAEDCQSGGDEMEDREQIQMAIINPPAITLERRGKVHRAECR